MTSSAPKILDRREKLWGIDRSWFLAVMLITGLFYPMFGQEVAVSTGAVLYVFGLLMSPQDPELILNWLLANWPFQRTYYEPFACERGTLKEKFAALFDR